MASNSFGNIFRLTSFGESHGVAIGGVIDGCPAGVIVDMDFVQSELNRRRPGQSHLTTRRQEEDRVELLSGVFEGKTTGAPIGFIIRNEDQKSEDYEALKDVYRPSHADYTYAMKYGVRDYRGGGRSSARETVTRVVAGAFAKMVLRQRGIEIVAYVSQIGEVKADVVGAVTLTDVEKSVVRCPDEAESSKMVKYIDEVRKDEDSVGGVVTCSVRGVPVGIGEPVYDKLSARLAYAMLSINAAKGVDYGSGFASVDKRGSELNDGFEMRGGEIRTVTNHSGGLLGGISNGEEIYFRVAFKPTATIGKEQKTVSTDGEEVILAAKGRHDTCVVPRAVVVVEAMAAIVVLDEMLMCKTRILDGK